MKFQNTQTRLFWGVRYYKQVFFGHRKIIITVYDTPAASCEMGIINESGYQSKLNL